MIRRLSTLVCALLVFGRYFKEGGKDAQRRTVLLQSYYRRLLQTKGAVLEGRFLVLPFLHRARNA